MLTKTCRFPWLKTAISLLLLCLGGSCGRVSTMADLGQRQDGEVREQGTRDGLGGDRAADGGPSRDGVGPRRDGAGADGARADAGNCDCDGGLVFLHGACVPTPSIGSCAPTCDVSAPRSCPQGQACDQWAASPSCRSAAAVPACVPGPSMGFADGTLRLSPVIGPAGGPTTVRLEGGDFYVGALDWLVSFGNEPPLPGLSAGGCRLDVSFTPPRPGAYPVTVSYGGHDPPALAGFFTATAGDAPDWIQPGYPCAASPPCAQAPPYACSCQDHRCRCQPTP